jgi:predicted dehydrogenase
MRGGLHLNGEKNSRLYDLKVDLGAGGVAFYDGATAKAEHIEAQKWIDAIRNDTEPVVTPDQALVVSEILEAIYESSKTGQLITF